MQPCKSCCSRCGMTVPDIDPFGCFGSEARGLACASRDLVYDRTMSFLSTLNVMSGLVLAAIDAPRPVPAGHGGAARGAEAADGRRVQRDGVCRGDHAAAPRCSRRIVYSWSLRTRTRRRCSIAGASPFRASSSAPFRLAATKRLLLWLTKMVLRRIYTATAWAKWACTGTVIAIYLFFHVTFGLSSSRHGRAATGAGRGLTLPYLFFNDRFRRDVVANSSLYFRCCRAGRPGGQGRGPRRFGGSRSARRSSPAEQELATFVTAALRTSSTRGAASSCARWPSRASRCRASRAAAGSPGGCAALLTTLELGSRGVELTRGDLALATAAMGTVSVFMYHRVNAVSPALVVVTPGARKIRAARSLTGSPRTGLARRRRAGRGPADARAARPTRHTACSP